jgi:hypothetical protein
VDGTQEIQQSFVHSPVKDANAAVLSKEPKATEHKAEDQRQHRKKSFLFQECLQ